MTKIAKYAGIALLVVALLLLFAANNALASIVEAFRPGYGVWAHLVLAGVELVAIGSFAASLFLRDKALRIKPNPSDEERRAFTRELGRRCARNSLTRHLDPADPHFLAQSLAILGEQADAEIKRTGQRVFLATALSQNGRLDGIIVFFVLCRLVWRISGIYNQRPHPGEILSLYSTVASSAFLAFSIEELDISTEIAASFGEMLHAATPAMATSAVPFVGSALQKFTSSVIDGSANCFLALRAGIIARNAFAFGIEGCEQPKRADVFKEAGTMLFSMSNGVLKVIVKAIKERFGRLVPGLGTRPRMPQTAACGQAAAATPGHTKIQSYTDAEFVDIATEERAATVPGNVLLRAGSAVGGTALRTGQAVVRPLAAPFRPRPAKTRVAPDMAADIPDAPTPDSRKNDLNDKDDESE